ncbi:type IV toxin-antitoxin system AbiEi family antitoxin domain-containing protein [Mycobacterium avium]|uniref:type IV toxin-antitoxin system AbiEi family antitoxin domain-containing protein n=1 Tax=Mycobacterium avium TaxID=1764 RepID=UPI001F1B65DB|nr:type IV toxin-antitoxin system AbiEi family antitoxin domain-containing protein [Mycobacterium avium]
MPRDAENRLAVEAAGQWGMFTAAQATRLGLTRVRLAQLTRSQRILRTETRGVYRFPGTPEHTVLDALRATWLSLQPNTFAAERLRNLHHGEPDAVVSHLSAAHYIFELGSLQPDKLNYTIASPRRTNNPWVEFHVADSWPPTWQLVDGLPVTPVAQTIADIYRDGIDAGHFGDIVRDALSRAMVDLRAITAELDPLTSGHGRDTIMHALAVVGAPDSIAAGNELLFTGRR